MRNKGRRFEQHLSDYTLFDIETCGKTLELRKHIIEISAIKIRDGKVVEDNNIDSILFGCKDYYK